MSMSLSKFASGMIAACGLACCGCTSFLGPYAPLKPEYAVQTPGEQQAQETTEIAFVDEPAGKTAFSSRLSADQPDSVTPVQANYGDSQVSAELPTTTQASSENPFALMAREGVRQTSLTLPEMPPMDAGFAAYAAAASSAPTTFHEASPRLPTAQPDCPVPLDVTIAASPEAHAYPDEYIFDGGDRDHPVHYYGGEMEGLDTEDTVAEFKDHVGNNHVKATNRVAVYAPRFGAVETVSGLKMGVKIDKAAGADSFSGHGALMEDKGLDANIRNSGAAGFAVRRSASGTETAQPPQGAQKVEGIVQAEKVDQGLEAHNRTGLGTLETTDLQELTIRILEPIASTNDKGVQTKATTSQATVTFSTFKVAATVGMEKGGRKGQLHLTKEASPLIAKPGDVITFKIQFQNIGDYNVQEVRIIDNLTPRLTYIDGTGQIAVADSTGGGLTVVPNKEGSQTLIFELDEPLRGGDSGSITFEARVR